MKEKIQGSQGYQFLWRKDKKLSITHDTNQINDTGKFTLGKKGESVIVVSHLKCLVAGFVTHFLQYMLT